MSKSMMSAAFAAGCVLALGAMSPTQAQTYMAPQPQPQPMIDAQLPPPAQPPGPGAGMQPVQMPTQLETNGPQASRGDFGDWSAMRNLLKTSAAFRHTRMRKECGPIGDPQMRQQCLASFEQYEPAMYGSSTPPLRHHQRRGAGE